MRTRLLALFACLALAASGCSKYRPVNAPLSAWDPAYGYRAANAYRGDVGEVLILMAFSGGGTRAAALAYGVLLELRDTEIEWEGERRRLLDEVDTISSVSGGSFTAAYYGLFGDRIFEDFEERFLYRNVQGNVILEMFRPRNWFRMASTFFDRSELAVEWYDRNIFERATFADLLRSDGPFVQINSTDLAVGNHFTFIQPQFDLMCSDLTPLEVARAVAASSAVPVLFSPITLRNYAGTCEYEPPEWFAPALADSRDRRRHWNAEILGSYLDPERRRFVHLVDGAISDNLGLRHTLDTLVLTGGIWKRMEELKVKHPEHLAVIVVNAQVHPDEGFSLLATAPSIEAIVDSVTSVQTNRYNFETVELMRENMEDWAWQLPLRPNGDPVRVHLVEVAFEDLVDPREKEFFNNLPTSFVLEAEEVDRLIEVGARLLRRSPDFRSFLEGLGATPRPERDGP